MGIDGVMFAGLFIFIPCSFRGSRWVDLCSIVVNVFNQFCVLNLFIEVDVDHPG